MRILAHYLTGLAFRSAHPAPVARAGYDRVPRITRLERLADGTYRTTTVREGS
jgi:hypothetical protein